jgi:hypothetical protein
MKIRDILPLLEGYDRDRTLAALGPAIAEKLKGDRPRFSGMSPEQALAEIESRVPQWLAFQVARWYSRRGSGLDSIESSSVIRPGSIPLRLNFLAESSASAGSRCGSSTTIPGGSRSGR